MRAHIRRVLRGFGVVVAVAGLFVVGGCDEDAAPGASGGGGGASGGGGSGGGDVVTPVMVAAMRDDPQRFAGIGEWEGVFETGCEGSGKTPAPGNGMTTWNSSVRVVGWFTLAPFNDPRNGPAITWRGKGEAHVVASGKRFTQYPEEHVTETFVGDYVDTINVEVSNIDLEARTYQLSIIRDLWQEQPHKGKCVESVSVTVNRYGSHRHEQMSSGPSWNNDGGAGFGRESPLPTEGYIISGSMKNKNTAWLDPTGELEPNHGWTTTWQLRPRGLEWDEPLKARAGGPYVVERGRTVNLDGFRSTGKIRSWRWTFAPAPGSEAGGVPFNRGAEKEGRHVPVVVLAPIRATLTVSDGEREDSETVEVRVVPREYTTPFHHRAGEMLHPRSTPPRMVKGHDIRFVGGENVCALCDYAAKDSVHLFHPGIPAGGTWRDTGYKLAQVKDAGGPFDGVWYVTGYALQIERQTLINKYILKGGPAPISHGKKFYDHNLELGNPIGAYLEAVRAHELLHSELAKAALPANDPGPKLEAMAARDDAALKAKADETIQKAEDAVDAASSDDLPLPSVGFEGTIAFPDDATDQYVPVEVAF